MPWETIGDCGGGSLPLERDRVLAELRLGLAFLEHYVGPAPAGCRLELLWRDFEPSYPTIALHWDAPATAEAIWGYVSECSDALSLLHESVSWDAIARILPEVAGSGAGREGDEWWMDG